MLLFGDSNVYIYFFLAGECVPIWKNDMILLLVNLNAKGVVLFNYSFPSCSILWHGLSSVPSLLLSFITMFLIKITLFLHNVLFSHLRSVHRLNFDLFTNVAQTFTLSYVS